MKVCVLVVFSLTFLTDCSRCESPYSAFSCAVGKRLIPPRRQDLVTKIFRLVHQGDRVPKDNVFFYLHTKEHFDAVEIVPGDANRLQSSTFDPSRPTKIITHGYLASKDDLACTLPKDAFLNSGDYNVIVIDWWQMQSLWGTIPLDCWTVASYVPGVADYVTTMIDFLQDQGMIPESTTLVGHSLGAHVMGIVGYQARKQVDYIVGLDPALPAFESKDHSQRLSVEDAAHVEVIHTNEGNCGMSDPIGHHDFYPNGGAKQPGCDSNSCSHARVYELYAESILDEHAFYGRRCLDFQSVKYGDCHGEEAAMGGSAVKERPPEGMYYLETRDSAPYAIKR